MTVETIRLVRRARITDLAHVLTDQSAEPGTYGTLEVGDESLAFAYPRMLIRNLWYRQEVGVSFERYRSGGPVNVLGLWLLRDMRSPTEIWEEARQNGLLATVDEAEWRAHLERSLGTVPNALSPEEAIEGFVEHHGLGRESRSLSAGILFARPVDDPPRDGWTAPSVSAAFHQLTGVASLAEACAHGADEEDEDPFSIDIGSGRVDVTGTLQPIADAFGTVLIASGTGRRRLYSLSTRGPIEAYLVREQLVGSAELFAAATEHGDEHADGLPFPGDGSSRSK